MDLIVVSFRQGSSQIFSIHREKNSEKSFRYILHSRICVQNALREILKQTHIQTACYLTHSKWILPMNQYRVYPFSKNGNLISAFCCRDILSIENWAISDIPISFFLLDFGFTGFFSFWKPCQFLTFATRDNSDFWICMYPLAWCLITFSFMPNLI